MYGETGALMRSEIAELLRFPGIQQRGRRTAMIPANGKPLEDLTHQILQYRHTILGWCRGAADSANIVLPWPNNVGHDPFRGGNRHPAISELRAALNDTYGASTAEPAGIDLLNHQHDNVVAEHWRQAALAAALAEHDTNGVRNAKRLTQPQAFALAADVAAITKALVVLDQRYRDTPHWESLAQPSRLGWTALACALEADHLDLSYTIDHTGWRPPVRPILGPAKPAIAGVLQAEHNLLAYFGRLPTALNLRRIVDSQRLLSIKLAERLPLADSEVAETWRHRSETHHQILKHLRDVGGRLGVGGPAALEGRKAITRADALVGNACMQPLEVANAETLFARIDQRITETLEHGFQAGAYYQRLTTEAIVNPSGVIAHPARERFVPVASPSDHPALQIAQAEFSAHRQPSTQPEAWSDQRASLRSALVQRPVANIDLGRSIL